jgi:hypothetical protein
MAHLRLANWALLRFFRCRRLKVRSTAVLVSLAGNRISLAGIPVVSLAGIHISLAGICSILAGVL